MQSGASADPRYPGTNGYAKRKKRKAPKRFRPCYPEFLDLFAPFGRTKRTSFDPPLCVLHCFRTADQNLFGLLRQCVYSEMNGKLKWRVSAFQNSVSSRSDWVAAESERKSLAGLGSRSRTFSAARTACTVSHCVAA